MIKLKSTRCLRLEIPLHNLMCIALMRNTFPISPVESVEVLTEIWHHFRVTFWIANQSKIFVLYLMRYTYIIPPVELVELLTAILNSLVIYLYWNRIPFPCHILDCTPIKKYLFYISKLICAYWHRLGTLKCYCKGEVLDTSIKIQQMNQIQVPMEFKLFLPRLVDWYVMKMWISQTFPFSSGL